MATGTSTQSIPRDQFIRQQLDRTSRSLKFVDLLGSCMILAAAILGYILVVAIIDHWLLPLGFVGRAICLLGLLAGCVWFIVVRVVPLLMKRINPAYAARTIERSEPTLKNSLINFLMLRKSPTNVHQVVYQALEAKAATDIQRVEVEMTVDRTHVFRIAYVLIGVLVLCAAYTILSPKSTFQSVQRMATPWADINNPTRVSISAVEPGDAEVFHGQVLDVTAQIDGLRADEPATLYFTTVDGLMVEQPIELESDESSFTYSCKLPESGGLQQSLTYYLRAGDARTPDFHVRVLPTPTITVERIQYDFPGYTELPKRTLERDADVRAIEGTKVTIFAHANQAIRNASLELSHDDTFSDPKQTQMLPMKSEEQKATRAFTLELKADRRTPKFSAYRLHFKTEDDFSNPDPTIHHIDVTRDLPPEVQILTPTKQKVELPENRSQKIEVRGIDPDYGLNSLRLKGVAGAVEVFNVLLAEDTSGITGQVVRTFDFSPRKLGITAGTEVEYWVIASDNRVNAATSALESNVTESSHYRILVLPSDEAPAGKSPNEKPEDKPESGGGKDEPKEKNEDGTDSGDEGEGGGESQDGREGDEGKEGSEKGEGQEGAQDGEGGQKGESGDQQKGNEGQGTGESTEGESGTEAGKTENGQPSDENTGAGQQGGESQPGEGGSEDQQHDGEVIEKMIEHFEEQQKKNQGKSGKGTQQSPQDGTGETENAGQNVEGSNTESAGDDSTTGTATDTSNDAEDGGRGQDTDANPPTDGEKTDPSEPQDGHAKDPNSDQPGDKKGAGAKNGSDEGEGGEPVGPMENPEDAEPKGNEQPAGEKSPGQGDNGDSGAGQQTDNNTGSPEAQETNMDSPKKGDNPDTSPKEGEEAQSPSTTKKQSDSQGESGGDRSGGGKQGGGQGANQKGNDSAGSNSSADQGAGKSDESGQGETADRAGDKQTADGRTGKSGEEKGSGTKSQQNPDGSNTGQDEQDGAAGGQPSDADKTDRKGQERGTEQGKGETGTTGGGGIAGNEDAGTPPAGGEVPDGDAANLDYAKKATDMILDRLEDQKENPDQALLDKLGWTKEELNAFMDRWKQLKQASQRDPKQAKELNETLRSLGLRPNTSRATRRNTQDDRVNGLRDGGTRSKPPAHVLERFNSYKKGVSRSR